MAKLRITGIAGYDGEYEFDPINYTNKELHTVKRIAGVRAGEIEAAFAAGDNDLIVAFAVLALERSGKAIHEEVLWNAKVGSIEFDVSDVEADADPPALGSDESANENKQSSGPPSNDDSDPHQNGLSRTGIQPSELSAA